MQVISGRNLSGGWFTSLMLGGLSYWIGLPFLSDRPGPTWLAPKASERSGLTATSDTAEAAWSARTARPSATWARVDADRGQCPASPSGERAGPKDG